MSSDKLVKLYRFFLKKVRVVGYERTAWMNLRYEIMETIQSKIDKIDKNMYVCHIYNQFRQMDGLSSFNITDMDLMRDFSYIDNLSNASKRIISEYIDIVINNNYELEDNNYDKAKIYFFKLYIPLFYKWSITEITSIQTIINSFNKLIGKHNMEYIHQNYYGKNNSDNYYEFNNKIFEKRNNDIFIIIDFLKHL